MAIDEDVTGQLMDIPSNSAVSLVTDLGNYFQAMKGVIQHTVNKKKYCIYITSTIPSNVIMDQLKNEGIEAKNIYFIDCISFMVGGAGGEEGSNVMYIESPTMLENIMLKINIWLKRLNKPHEDVIVFLDSVNTLAMHNDERLISEFLHYIINSLRARNILTVVLSVQGQTPEDIETIMQLVCDETIIATETEAGSGGREDGDGADKDK